MDWKNTKQLSLADAFVSQHKVITALDDLHALIDWERIKGMLVCIHATDPLCAVALVAPRS